MGLVQKAAIQLMRLIPGSKAHGIASTWRDLERLEDADVALVSFPKSGRTFVRTMLARLYQRQYGIDDRELLKFATLRRAGPDVPRILFTHDGDAMRRPAQIKLDRKAYRNKRVALLARHPGDIVVSRYYHLKHRSLDPARQRLAQQDLENFVWTEQGGIPSIVRFLNRWADYSRQRGDILIVRYEDFLRDPATTLQALAEYVGLNSDDAAIREAVEFGSFDNLKKLEREGYFRSGRLGPGRAGNEESFKVRSGKSGGFRAQLSRAGQEKVIAYVRDNLDPIYGYGR
jgi:Sulfotransferase domain